MNTTQTNENVETQAASPADAKPLDLPSKPKKNINRKVKPPKTGASIFKKFSSNLKAVTQDDDENEEAPTRLTKKTKIKRENPKKQPADKKPSNNVFAKVGRAIAGFFKKIKNAVVNLLMQMGIVKDPSKTEVSVTAPKRSLKSKITVAVIVAVLICSVCIAVGGLFLTYTTALSTLEKTMTETAGVAAARTEKEILAYMNIAFETGCNERLSTNDLAAQSKQAMLRLRVKYHEFESSNIIARNGIGLFDDKDYSEFEYFAVAEKGETVVSDATLNEATGLWEVTIAAPLWSNGKPRTTVQGVVTFVPNASSLNNIVTPIAVGETGRAYILNKNGDVIAKPEGDVIAPTLEQIQKTENGFVKFSQEGKTYISAAQTMPELNDWTIVIVAEQDEFMQQFKFAMVLMIVLVLAFIVVFAAVAFIIGERITYPIKLCVERLSLLSMGDFNSPVPQIKTGDETQILATATADVTEKLKSVIADISETLTEMSKGNFDVSFDAEYHGDLEPIKKAGDDILYALNLTLNKIHTVASEVALGSKQVSIGAQILSDGATVQAGGISTLAEKLSSVEKASQQSAASAKIAKEKTDQTNMVVLESNKQMVKLTEAMNEIRRTSFDIGGVIKTIDDIAFQTNILALNAAVEAARAGADGKGFSVVADEIRRLAEKSSMAAESTLDLIQSSINAIKNGNNLAMETAKQLKSVVKDTNEVVTLVEEISKSCNKQFDEIAIVAGSIDSITTVVQSNSATSEESAATSEELSSQSVFLKQLLDKFNLCQVEDISDENKSPANDLAYFSALPFEDPDADLSEALSQANVNYNMALELDQEEPEAEKAEEKLKARASKYDDDQKATPKPQAKKKTAEKKTADGEAEKPAPKKRAPRKTTKSADVSKDEQATQPKKKAAPKKPSKKDEI